MSTSNSYDKDRLHDLAIDVFGWILMLVMLFGWVYCSNWYYATHPDRFANENSDSSGDGSNNSNDGE